MKHKFEIRRTSAVLALTIASIGGGTVASLMVAGHGQTVPIFVGSAQAASVEPAQMLSFNGVVKHAAPAVVNISSTTVIKASDQQRGMQRRGRGQQQQQEELFNDPFFRQFFGDGMRGMAPRDRRESSLGSGVIVSKDGYILTNNHVVENATKVKVTLGDKREFTAKTIGTDPATDVAVIKIDATDLPVLPLSGVKPQVGDLALAIGNPFGIGQTVTMGIVGAIGRNMGGSIEQYEDFIQTDASINPGNSGGALINSRGELIGINTAIISPNGGGNNGIGFAVPVSMARNVMDQLMRNGKVSRGYIGASLQEVDGGLARALHLPSQSGAVIVTVEPGGPAEKAGLKSGDVVTQINGDPVADVAGLRLQVASLAPGTNAKFHLLRDGQARDINVTLKERDAELAAKGERIGKGDNTGTGKHSALDGVSVDDLTPQMSRQLQLEAGVKGVVVTDVEESSQAAEAGLQRGDVILEVNRTPVRSVSDLDRLTKSAKGGETLLLVTRGGVTRFIALESK